MVLFAIANLFLFQKSSFFHMCFGMLSPFHSATQITSIQNHNCSKNAKTLHLVTLSLNSQIIIGFSELTSNENSRRWIWMCDAFHINGRQLHIYHLWKSIPHSWKSIPKIMSAHAFFCVFRTLQTMNGYDFSGQMKRALNYDSKTHVKTQNPTSRTEIGQNSLKYLFLETPCRSCEISVDLVRSQQIL